jgi:uncharacterized protein YbbK (DUF523 family)
MGIECRYDGRHKANDVIIALSKNEPLVPVCPEQLGGLPTPREPAEQKGDTVITTSGKDVTEKFTVGATRVLAIAKALGIKEAILKQKSPSCGCGNVYDGTFSNTLIEGDGVTTKLLKQHGITVTSEHDV